VGNLYVKIEKDKVEASLKTTPAATVPAQAVIK